MQLRRLNIGCFGGGTGLPSLLGGLKTNPWLNLNAVVTMFDSGGSSGQLRDELGVLPPGDVLRCALALARNEREARRVLLARLADPRARAARGAHRRQPAAVDDGAVQRRLSRGGRRAPSLLGCPRARVAGQRRKGEYLRGIRRRHHDHGGSGGRCRTVSWPSDRAVVARTPGQSASRRREGHPAVRRRHHRSRQFLYEPDADLSGQRCAGSDPAGPRARSFS